MNSARALKERLEWREVAPNNQRAMRLNEV